MKLRLAIAPSGFIKTSIPGLRPRVLRRNRLIIFQQDFLVRVRGWVALQRNNGCFAPLWRRRCSACLISCARREAKN
jgi:hypothetical protein